MCEHVRVCILYVAVAVGAALAEPFIATEVATVQTDLFAEQQPHSWATRFGSLGRCNGAVQRRVLLAFGRRCHGGG